MAAADGFPRRNLPIGAARAVGRLAAVALCYVAVAATAQEARTHYQHHGVMPPGMIGAMQLQRGGPLPGYFQPVEILTPAGTQVSLANAGAFTPPEPAPMKVGLLLGAVYRLRVTDIPLQTGAEVFPTIEVINRLYPPPGQEVRFAMPIEITREDLELALHGQFVTRVIYLEDPRTATPTASLPGSQSWFDIGPGRDPLAVADALGRPMAILRIGGRLPTTDELSSASFLYGCPQWLRFRVPEPPTLPETPPATVPAPNAAVPSREKKA